MKRKVVRTPTLFRCWWNRNYLECSEERTWNKVKATQKYFDLPSNFEFVWIEFSNRQFPDRSGLRGTAKFVVDSYGEVLDLVLKFDGRKPWVLEDSVDSFDFLLKPLGVTDKPIRVFMRVLYAERRSDEYQRNCNQA